MPGVGFLLLLNLIAAGPEVVLRAPRLSRGDEITYRGQIIEVGEQLDNRFRKEHELELRLFVLETQASSVDCALMTKVRPKLDPAVAVSAEALAGSELLQKSSAAVRLDLIRIDERGQVRSLVPSVATTPFQLSTAKTQPLPALPLEIPPLLEVGMFLPLPGKPVSFGSSWQTFAENRPPLLWTLQDRAVWNGSQCLKIQLRQQSDGWEQNIGLMTRWLRTEELLFSPGDGHVHKMTRKIERREGQNLIGWMELQYEADQITRRLGSRYNDVRREIELAYLMLEELRGIIQTKGRPSTVEHRTAMTRLERFTDAQPLPGPFHDALESARRQWGLAVRGELVVLPTTSKPAQQTRLPEIGEIFPDFLAPRIGTLANVQLARLRGKPVVLLLFRPGAETASDSLAVCEACQEYFGDQVRVVSLTIREAATVAEPLQTRLKLKHWLADGQAIRPKLDVPAWPMLMVLDGQGRLTWQFVGQGPETGYLLKQELERVLKAPNPRNR